MVVSNPKLGKTSDLASWGAVVLAASLSTAWVRVLRGYKLWSVYDVVSMAFDSTLAKFRLPHTRDSHSTPRQICAPSAREPCLNRFMARAKP